MPLKIQCPTCRGKKTMNDPKYSGQVMFYSGINGERCPQVDCITCGGVGHVLDNSAPFSVDEDAKNSLTEDPKSIGIKNLLEHFRNFVDNGLQRKPAPVPSLDELHQQLKAALAAEDYEKAAIVRDEIKRREQ